MSFFEPVKKQPEGMAGAYGDYKTEQLENLVDEVSDRRGGPRNLRYGSVANSVMTDVPLEVLGTQYEMEEMAHKYGDFSPPRDNSASESLQDRNDALNMLFSW
jgi:hypothetical protein